MELELEGMEKANISLDLQLVELREKLNATSCELSREHEQNRSKNALLKKIRIDLHDASGLIQEPKRLKDTVRVSAGIRNCLQAVCSDGGPLSFLHLGTTLLAVEVTGR